MARTWSCGFELNSLTDGVEFDTVSGASFTIQSSIKRSGSYALKCTGTGTNLVRHQYIDSVAAGVVVYARAYIYIETAVGALTTIFSFINPGLTSRIGIRLDTDRTLILTSGEGDGRSSALATGTWHRLDMVYDFTNKTLTGKVNGTQFATTTYGTSISHACVECYFLSAASGSIIWDDIAVNDNSGTVENSYPSDGKLEWLSPNAAGSNNAWLDTAGSAGTTNNYQLVDEIPPNDATDFVECKTATTDDFYNMSATGANTDNGDVINVVQVMVRYKGLGASANASFKTQLKKTSGGTVAQSAAITPNSVTWRTNANAVPRLPTQTLYKDPDNSDWTTSTLNSMQVGVSLTTTNTNYSAVSAIGVYVEYRPAVIVADTGVGTDAVSVAAAVPVSETGHGTDIVSVAAAVPVSETGHGTDAVSVQAQVTVADTGHGVDAISASMQLEGIGEVGHGVDTVSVVVQTITEEITAKFSSADVPTLDLDMYAPVVDISEAETPAAIAISAVAPHMRGAIGQSPYVAFSVKYAEEYIS